MKKLNQKGFGAVEVLLIVVVLALVVGGGYFVWNKNHKKVAAPASTTNSSTSTNLTATQAEAKVTQMYQAYFASTTGTNAAARLPVVRSYFSPDAYKSVLKADNDLVAYHQDTGTNYDYLMCEEFGTSKAAPKVLSSSPGKTDGSLFVMISYTRKDGVATLGADDVTISLKTGLITDKICMR